MVYVMLQKYVDVCVCVCVLNTDMVIMSYLMLQRYIYFCVAKNEYYGICYVAEVC